MKRANEKGAALILALILVLMLSIIAVSLTFLSQSETWSSMNYRLMSQARYGAESGLNKTLNYLIYTYVPPATLADLNAYNMTVSPVTAGGNAVILSANSSQSNYPVSSVQSAFSTAAQGTLTNGRGGSMNYAASAKLLSMRQVNVYGSPTPATIQTWQITSDGTIGGVRNAQVEVSAILERQITPVFGYAVFAQSPNCDALDYSGGGSTDSYDSSTVSNGTVTTQSYGGDVGTDGNLTSANSTTIDGSLSTPRAGVGNCGTGDVTAWTGNGTVTGGVIELPQPITYPLPSAPNPTPPTTTESSSGDCGSISPGCTNGPNGSKVIWLVPGQYGNLSASGGAIVHLSAGIYNINSISLSGNTTIVIDSGPVIVNVSGTGQNTPIDTTGGTITNSSLNPMNLQIQYAGSGTIKLAGGSQTSGLVYAPNATINLTGQAPWYGALIGNNVKDSGGAAVHYDRRLKNTAFTLGNYMVSSFTWKKD